MDELEFCVDLEKFDQRDAALESLFRQDPGVAFALSLPDLRCERIGQLTSTTCNPRAAVV